MPHEELIRLQREAQVPMRRGDAGCGVNVTPQVPGWPACGAGLSAAAAGGSDRERTPQDRPAHLVITEPRPPVCVRKGEVAQGTPSDRCQRALTAHATRPAPDKGVGDDAPTVDTLYVPSTLYTCLLHRSI